jgi:myo-inositol-1(or 4)-monophosphatase
MERATETRAAELEVALAAAREAATVLLQRAGSGVLRRKGRADLVTQADEEAERVIQHRIGAAFPGDGFVAEEFSTEHHVRGRRWIVDPLDGTVNFVHGHPFSCVSIALVDDEGPAVAVVHAPFLGEVFHAVRGAGAFLNGEPISVSDTADPGEALLATGFPFKAGKGEPGPYLELVGEAVLSTHGVRRCGAAAIDLAYVACGRVDGFFEIGLSPWDVAAGILLVTEGGGVVTGWNGDAGAPLETGSVLASNGRIHAWLRDTTGRYVDRL